jgi:hypothetical protein
LNKDAHTIAHGTVISRLPDLLRLAGQQWMRRYLSYQEVARATSLNPKTVALLGRIDPSEQTRDYYCRTLGLLCWYFDCGIDSLLLWEPPPALAQRRQIPALRIGRCTPPSEPPPETITLQSTIASRLSATGKRPAELVRLTGLSFDTIADLMNREHHLRRINRETLALLCTILSRPGDNAYVEPHDLLRYDGGQEHVDASAGEHTGSV